MFKYRIFSGLYFPVFGMNTEIYRVNLRVHSKYGEIQTRKNSSFGHFFAVLMLNKRKDPNFFIILRCEAFYDKYSGKKGIASNLDNGYIWFLKSVIYCDIEFLFSV